MSLSKAVAHAFGVFRVAHEGGKPDLIPTGIGPLDKEIGGLLSGETMILGMERGLGKSSLILDAALSTPVRCHILSLEDGPEVWGARALARETGIDSRRIRKGDLSSRERKLLAEASIDLEVTAAHVELGVDIAADVDRIEENIYGTSAKLVYLDYIQKSRPDPNGPSPSRRDYIGEVLARSQRACMADGKALILASQFSRPDEATRRRGGRPHLGRLKETGDLENEARVVLLGWREEPFIRVWLAKSTWGAEGLEWAYYRDSSGALRLCGG